MLDGERLVWAAAAIALVTAFLVTLVITHARATARHGRDHHETRLFANVVALGLLVVVLVAVAFVAGYAALERRSEYVVIAASVLGIGIVLYNDATRPHRATHGASLPCEDATASAPFAVAASGFACDDGRAAKDAIPAASRANTSEGTAFDSVFKGALGADDSVVLAAAARAETCVTGAEGGPLHSDDASDGATDEVPLRPYTLGVRFGRIPRA